jgi:uncharacterized protein with von Willebrand factor type A (vWA) domain
MGAKKSEQVMTEEQSGRDFFLWLLFKHLRRQKFLLGPEEYHALRHTLAIGFGWGSRDALCNLCCVLWAKSPEEQQIVRSLFNNLAPPAQELEIPIVASEVVARSDVNAKEKQLADEETTFSTATPIPEKSANESLSASAEPRPEERNAEPALQRHSALPTITIEQPLPEKRFLLKPEFPLGFREVAQAWRRLRQSVREGPATEIDLQATIKLRSYAAVASPVVLVPPRRNTARLLLLIDRQGSMAPFHRFVEQVCTAILKAGRLKHVEQYYFHDVPAAGADESVLANLDRQLFPSLDPVLARIQPLTSGYVYHDPALLHPHPLSTVLNDTTTSTAVVLISDGGAARQRYEVLRLLDTIASLKALRSRTTRIVWINPLPREHWQYSTAEQIARHIPMFALDKNGMYQAVDVLRGKPYLVEKPL